MNHNIFRRLSAVSSFSPTLLAELIEVTGTPFEVGENEILLSEGESDDAFMIIVEGRLEIMVGEPPVVIATVGPGAMLGEMAIFGLEQKRRASVVTRTRTIGVIFQREGIEELRRRGHPSVTRLEGQAVHAAAQRLREMNERFSELVQGTALEPVEPAGLLERLKSWLGWSHKPAPLPKPDPVEVLQGSRVFGTLPEPTVKALAGSMEMIAVGDGDIILEQGAFGRDAWIIASGRVGVYRAVQDQESERMDDLLPGDVFGLVGLLHGAARTATCIAVEPTWLMFLSAEVYNTFTTPTSPGAPFLHRAIYEAQASQLAQANQRVAHLIAVLAKDRKLDGKSRLAYYELIKGSL